MNAKDLTKDERRARSRRKFLALGSLMLAAALFSGIFISLTQGWRSSVSWLDDFIFTAAHVPFFFFLISAMLTLYFLYEARQGYRLAPIVAASPDYIDFDRIRRRWLQRFRDKLSFELSGWFANLIFFLILFGLVALILWVVKSFSALFS